jgi:hypothetical protein
MEVSQIAPTVHSPQLVRQPLALPAIRRTISSRVLCATCATTRATPDRQAAQLALAQALHRVSQH